MNVFNKNPDLTDEIEAEIRDLAFGAEAEEEIEAETEEEKEEEEE